MRIETINAVNAQASLRTNKKNAPETPTPVEQKTETPVPVSTNVVLAQMPNVSFAGKKKKHKKEDNDMTYDQYTHAYQLSEQEKNPKPEEHSRDDFDDDYAAYCSSCINASHYNN